MIKELKLTNWKSFSDSTLYVDPVTIIIGTNASGKSNILDAFLLLQRLSFGKQITAAVNGDTENPGGIRGGLEWVVRKPERETTLDVLIGAEDESEVDYRYIVKFGLVNGSRIELLSESLTREKKQVRKDGKYQKNLFSTAIESDSKPSIIAYFNSGTRGYGNKIELSRSFSILSQSESLKLRKEVSEGCSVVLTTLRSIFILDPIPSHMRKYSSLSESLLSDASNISGVLAALAPEKKVEVEDILTKYLSHLPEKDIARVYTELVGKFQTDAMLYCEECWKDDKESFTVDLRGMSDGTLRFLAILVALLTRDANSLLIIEEIDNGLHPSRAKLLVEMLQKVGEERRIDVICTTHNPAMLDALGNRMIPFIAVTHRDTKTGSSLITQLEDVNLLPKLISYGSIGSIASSGELENAITANNQ